MENVSPWLICIGVFCLWPSVLFVVGFIVGRRGLPFRIEKTEQWRREDQ